MKPILFVTTNQQKYNELFLAATQHGIIISQGKADIAEIQSDNIDEVCVDRAEEV